MTERKIRNIIADALEVNPSEISDENSEAWDSLNHVTILVALDSAFDGKVAEIKEIQEAYSVASIINILRKNGLVS